MKTPFDNFESFVESDIVPFTDGKNVATSFVLKHKLLPITIKETSYDCSKLPMSKLIEKTYRTLFLIYKHHVAVTHYLEYVHYKTHPLGKIGYVYSPEWDKEQEKWFVMDEQNKNRIYE